MAVESLALKEGARTWARTRVECCDCERGPEQVLEGEYG